MSKISKNKVSLLSLWIVGVAVASFATMPSMAFAGGYDKSEDKSDSSTAKGESSPDNGATAIDTQTYDHVKTKTTTTDIHKQITKKEIVGTKTTVTTKVSEDEKGDTGKEAIAAAEASGSSVSGDCECSATNGDSSPESTNSDEGSDSNEEY